MEKEIVLQKTICPTTVSLNYDWSFNVWVGWFGFNGGSALAADSTASQAILVTHIAASLGAFSWIIIEWIRFGKPSLVGMATGMVAGLATITPASGFVGVQGALVLGLSGGVLCYVLVDFIRIKMKIDDSLDVFAVHGIGGMLGTILCATLMQNSFGGIGLDDGITVLSQFKVQTYAVIVTALWTIVLSYVILKLISMFMTLELQRMMKLKDWIIHFMVRAAITTNCC